MAFAALTIDINAKLANLEAGLKRVDSQLGAFGAKAESVGATLGAVFGAVAGGAVFAALTQRLAGAVDELAKLDDAAESTGASVEELSSILNTVAPTGVGLEQVTEYATKLAKAMREAETPTSDAAAAFKALGVATRDSDGNLRSTGAVLEDVARALQNYADGTNKTALAQILLGKSGAEALPFLKDLAGRTKEAATVSAEAAAEAERLQNAWRAIKRDGELFAQSIASAIIPALADLSEQFRATGKAGGTFWDQIRGVLGPNKAIADYEKDLAGLQGQKELAKRLGLSDAAIADYEDRIARVQKSIDALRPAQRIRNGPSATELLYGDAGYGAANKPQAPMVATGDGIDKARKAYEEFDAFVRQTDINATLDEEAKAAKALADQLSRAADAALRRLADVDKSEAQAEEALQKELDKLRDMIDPTRALYRELDRIRELMGAGLLSNAEGNAAQAPLLSKIDELLQQVPEKAKEANDAARQLGLTFSSAFENAISGGEKLSNVIQGLAQDIVKIFIRKQFTEPFTSLLTDTFKGAGGGATVFDSIRGAFGSLFGRAIGGPVSSGTPYMVGERGPELFVPTSSGRIVPGASGGVVVQQNISVASGVSRAEFVAALAQSREAAVAAVSDAARRGSLRFA